VKYPLHAAALALGCFRLLAAESEPATQHEPLAWQPPAFISGGMALLLTNVEGFGSRVVMKTPAASNKAVPVAGELLGRQGKLVFLPEGGAPGKKGAQVGGVSYIWDVTRNSGYLVSEAMQGYAPIVLNTRFTNLSAKAVSGGATASKIEGHLCQPYEVTVLSSNGASAAFRVWRAADLKEFPVRIDSEATSAAVSVTFSKIVLQPPPEELFQPPEGFTKFANPEVMLDELRSRQLNLRRKPPVVPRDREHEESPTSRPSSFGH
jgi:hypothetical protein